MSYEYYIAYLGKVTNITNKTYSSQIPVKFKVKKKKNFENVGKNSKVLIKKKNVRLKSSFNNNANSKRQLKKRKWKLMILDRANISEILRYRPNAVSL